MSRLDPPRETETEASRIFDAAAVVVIVFVVVDIVVVVALFHSLFLSLSLAFLIEAASSRGGCRIAREPFPIFPHAPCAHVSLSRVIALFSIQKRASAVYLDNICLYASFVNFFILAPLLCLHCTKLFSKFSITHHFFLLEKQSVN